MSESSTQSKDQSEIVNRLRSAEGHLRAVIRMVEEDEPCEQVLHQPCPEPAERVGAVEAALRAAGGILLDCQVQRCVEIILHNRCADERVAELERLARLYPLAARQMDFQS